MGVRQVSVLAVGHHLLAASESRVFNHNGGLSTPNIQPALPSEYTWTKNSAIHEDTLRSDLAGHFLSHLP